MIRITDDMTFSDVEALPHMERAAGFLMEMPPEAAAAFAGMSFSQAREQFGTHATKRVRLGLERLAVVAAELGRPDIDLWDSEAIDAVPARERTRLFRFPAPEPGAPFVLVCPGGGYCTVCSALEGFSFAKELNDAGYAAFVLSYRTREDARMPAPIEDAAQAVRTVLARADELQVAPRYAVAGFSAGAHLAGELCTDNWGWEAQALPRPEAAVLGYPALDTAVLAAEPAENEIVTQMLGAMFGGDRGDEALAAYNVTEHATSEFPPTFTFQAEDDAVIPFLSSLRLVSRLSELGVPFEYHASTHGGHGLMEPHDASADRWPEQATAFLRDYL